MQCKQSSVKALGYFEIMSLYFMPFGHAVNFTEKYIS